MIATSVLSACGPVVSHTPTRVRVQVRPRESLVDQPLSVVITGLRAGQDVRVAVTSVDADGVQWASNARFRCVTRGTVDLATSPSLGGSYIGLDPMGIISAMTPVGHRATAYFWGFKENLFRLTVYVGGRAVAVTSFERRAVALGVTIHAETLAAEGFIGQYWAPPKSRSRGTAVIEFGGSEGGLDGQLLGAALASIGYPTLDVAYFGEPGLPRTLSHIPLEYFAGAVKWLGAQPGVSHQKIFVLGGSRGSEAALLLGVYYPALVHGVIAVSPSNVALCSYPSCSGPAWTLHGRALPYTTQFNDPAPTDNPQAVIPVQNIKGPIFLACGGDDRVWDSCAYARAIMARLSARHNAYTHVLYSYPTAGHGIDTLVPYEPVRVTAGTEDLLGAASQSNQIAEAELWPHVLSFLAA
ncbi:MAG: acyl-CoA thioesterase/bile acid-CoA:amino acid N-acyltransferase family protein [Candidatus Dormibacteraeota bacterium]|nr:acyl-CoA thioesterase/bile acid-CoA:amino acid N-acyltransferase family protein [Candidatus Dormibacteraeota bacterium]